MRWFWAVWEPHWLKFQAGDREMVLEDIYTT